MKTPLPLIRMFALAALLLSVLPLTVGAADATQETVLLDTWNTELVKNGPAAKCTFQVDKPFLVTYVNTYHWNDGSGTQKPGTISLRHEDGMVYGPWAANGLASQDGVPNIIWVCQPKKLIKPGNYEIVDGDKHTWAQNKASGRRGMAKVQGLVQPVGTGDSVPVQDRCISRQATYQTSSNYSDDYPSLPSLLTGDKELHTGRLQNTEDVAPEFAFHTAREANPWVVIDLGCAAMVEGLKVENRLRQQQERAKGLTLYLSLDGKNWTECWTDETAKPVWQLALEKPVAARFVKLALKRKDYLHLAHVEVYGVLNANAAVTPAVSATPAAPLASDFATLPPLAITLEPSAEAQRIDFHKRLTVVIPGGLLKQPATLKIQPQAALPPEAAGQYSVLGACDISLGELHQLDQDLVLEASYDPAQLEKNRPAVRQVQALRWDSDKKIWVALKFAVDEERKLIIMRTSHLSIQGWFWKINNLLYQERVDVKNLIAVRTDRFILYVPPTSLDDLPHVKNWPEDPEQASYYQLHGIEHDSWKSHRKWSPEAKRFVGSIMYFLDRSYTLYAGHFTEPAEKLPIPIYMTVSHENDPPACYGQDTGSMNLRADPKPPENNFQGFKHTVAHEVFHIFQGVLLNYSAEKMTAKSALWWIESTAEYASCRVVWNLPLLGGVSNGGVWPRLLQYPLTFSGNAREYTTQNELGSSLEYDRGWFIDQLIRSGLSFPRMFEYVQYRYAKGASPLDALRTYVSEWGKPLGYQQREFSAWFMFSADSPLAKLNPDGRTTMPRTGRTGIPLLSTENLEGCPAVCPPAGKGALMYNFTLEACYTSQAWAVKATRTKTNTPVALLVEAVDLSPGACVDVYLLPDNLRQKGELRPVGSITQAGGSVAATLEFGDVGNDDDLDIGVSGAQLHLSDILYIVATNIDEDKMGAVQVRVLETPIFINTVQPNIGPGMTSVTLKGKGFGPAPVKRDKNRLFFDDKDCTSCVTAWKDDEIQMTIPAPAISGSFMVITGGVQGGGGHFTVTSPPAYPRLGTFAMGVGQSTSKNIGAPYLLMEIKAYDGPSTDPAIVNTTRTLNILNSSTKTKLGTGAVTAIAGRTSWDDPQYKWDASFTKTLSTHILTMSLMPDKGLLGFKIIGSAKDANGNKETFEVPVRDLRDH